MEVELVRWPAQQQRRARLRSLGAPRLLLIDPETPPPLCNEPEEDWVRLPARHDDIRARREAVAARTLSSAPAPQLDDWGVLRWRTIRVALPPIEARLARMLLERYESVITRNELVAAGWPGETPARNALDVRIMRLRRRIASAGLNIRTVRSQGYLLEPLANAAFLSG